MAFAKRRLISPPHFSTYFAPEPRMDLQQLKAELKQLIIDECEKECSVADISDDEPLVGADAPLELDSLDTLQLSLAIKQRYGKRIEGNNETRQALRSINHLAAFINA
jgi:acyl carrier protein